MKTIFIKCSCGAESLCLEKDREDDLLYISIWERGAGRDNRYTWKQRIKHCWYVLTNGKPYGDQLVLDRAARSELVYALVDSYIINKVDNTKNGSST